MGLTNQQKTEIKEVLAEFITSGKANSTAYIPVLLKIENEEFSKGEAIFIDEIEELVCKMMPAKKVCWIVGGIEKGKSWIGLAVLDRPDVGKEKIIFHNFPYQILITIK